MTMQNPWEGFLGAEPKSAYFSYGDRFGGASGNQRQRNYFTNKFTDLYNVYLGRLASQVRGGQAPTEQFQDYLGGFDFDKWYRENQTSQQRNPDYSSFVPRTRWSF